MATGADVSATGSLAYKAVAAVLRTGFSGEFRNHRRFNGSNRFPVFTISPDGASALIHLGGVRQVVFRCAAAGLRDPESDSHPASCAINVLDDKSIAPTTATDHPPQQLAAGAGWSGRRRRFASLRYVGALMLREMATTNGRSPGGFLWDILEPVAGIAILTFACSFLFEKPPFGTTFALFYATGTLPFFIFTS